MGPVQLLRPWQRNPRQLRLRSIPIMIIILGTWQRQQLQQLQRPQHSTNPRQLRSGVNPNNNNNIGNLAKAAAAATAAAATILTNNDAHEGSSDANSNTWLLVAPRRRRATNDNTLAKADTATASAAIAVLGDTAVTNKLADANDATAVGITAVSPVTAAAPNSNAVLEDVVKAAAIEITAKSDAAKLDAIYYS